MSKDNVAIEVKDLGFMHQIANKPVFKDLNFTIEKGEFIGLIGMNGVGKTTLCNILRGIIPKFIPGEIRGEVFIDGRDINEYDMGEMAEKIGFVFQNPFIQISGIKKTVFEEVAYGLENLGVPKEEIIERTKAVLKQLDIEYLQNKHPSELSGGQSQRVALASVLVMEPEILLVDEPTSQLDPKGTEEVFDALGILKEQNKTVILVEHKIDLISEYADRVIVLGDSGIVMEGTTEEVLSNPEIEKYGVPMPKIVALSHELKDKGLRDFKTIPTTIADALEEFKEEI